VCYTGLVRESQRHCQQCGSTDRENVDTQFDADLQGYSACCNELVLDTCDEYCDHEGAQR
jgi:hypothetical protein